VVYLKRYVGVYNR